MWRGVIDESYQRRYWPGKLFNQKTCKSNGLFDDDGCGAILEVELKDLTRYQGKDWDGDSYDDIIFSCPCCGNEIYVDEKELPKPAYERVKIKRFK